MSPTEAPPGRLDRLHRLRDPMLAVTSAGVLLLRRPGPLRWLGGVGIGLCVLVAIAPVVFNVL